MSASPSLGLFLLPLPGAFFVFRKCDFWRYYLQKEDSNRLFFFLAFFAVILLACARLLIVFLATYLPNESCVVAEAARLTLKQIAPFDFSGTLLLSVLLCWPLTRAMNHHFGASEDAYFQIVDSLPDAKLISLLNIAQAEGVPILVTLKNRKTYVGYVDQFSLNHDCHHFQIFPTDSGYRSEHELDVCLRNKYTRILEIFKAIKERAATQEDLEVLRRLKIILRTDDVVSASLWDWDIWDQHRRAREAPPASGLCRALTE